MANQSRYIEHPRRDTALSRVQRYGTAQEADGSVKEAEGSAPNLDSEEVAIIHATEEEDINTQVTTPVTQTQRFATRKSKLSDERCKWQSHLYISDMEQLDNTLLGTTQLAVVKNRPELTILKQHAKRRLHKLQYTRLSEIVYTNTMITAFHWESVKRYKYMQLFVGSDSHYMHGYLMKKKSEFFPDALEDFLTYVGTPSKLVSDNAREEIQNEVKKHLSKLLRCKNGSV
jgi:hypothetical protein